MYKFLLVALLFVGCTKYPDAFDPVACNCKVVSMVDTFSNINYYFEYDAKNRLEYRSVTFSNPMSPSFKVIYDNLGRPASYLANANYNVGGFFEEWHFLYYNNKNEVVVDSIFSTGFVGTNGRPLDPMDSSVTRFEYDAQHRIIKETNSKGYGHTYVYNAAGNLAGIDNGAPITTYDDKVNFNRTDLFLQFIDRDYSKNNRVLAAAYNQYGLPLAYPYVKDAPQLPIDNYSFASVKITYKCKS